ncbi:hypothetical protein JAAARDRAFT_28474 [Jaapia argillacea MUCL 33604]|uniref:Elongator complex protein 2 n=1 Tax=Jaapia argillacea MUCL 33604 TaxID=933084 RepID=A0A067QMR1_9AGAM|nr:hypothetical protein JAAARDRAFT_28474 [Jaapia argillacea MUCL 33604]
MASTSTTYISASTNRHPHVADASSSGLIAFGSGKLIALWDSSDRGVRETLPGHQGLVTCVQFIQDDWFISADDQGVVKGWRNLESEWKETTSLVAHLKAISCLCFCEKARVTGSSDGSVKIWNYQEKEKTELLTEVQHIPLHGRFPLSLKVANLPRSSAVVLAIGGTDKNIQIWTRSEELFVRSATLSGHEDWVRSLDFRTPPSPNEPLVLASGSQDGIIRLWNVEVLEKDKPESDIATENGLSDELLDEFEASLGSLGDSEEGGRQISLKRHIVTVKNQGVPQRFTITFDALLIGHEAGVTALSWRPASNGEAIPTLLSTSTDSSLILWSPSTIITHSKDESTSLWINRQRFGDVGGQRLGGFVGGLWASDGKDALAWGWAGGWRRWRCSPSSSNQTVEKWDEIGAISGHSGPIRGLSWSPGGEYLISAGLDQTTRIHGPIPTNITEGKQTAVWHEIGRPQVHGYDIVGVEFLDPLHFVSVADEKVARVFEAPRNFLGIVKGLGIAELSTEEVLPAGASVPPLGLSNKATNDPSSGPVATTLLLSSRRPFEGELAAMTLWPETEKVFGHGYESITLAVSNDKKLLATACKATTAEHAVVRVYDTAKWQPVGQPLLGHTLTVTRISFSPDDRFIVTVSRDRTWRLFERQEQDAGYVPVAAEKSHSRIIWDCAWASCDKTFATASRDKTVKIWRPKGGSTSKWTAVATIKTKEAATAIAFKSIRSEGDSRLSLAVGLETGEILVYSNTSGSEWKLEVGLGHRIAHVDQIHHLAWRPTAGIQQLASCSEDGTLKITTVHTNVD